MTSLLHTANQADNELNVKTMNLITGTTFFFNKTIIFEKMLDKPLLMLIGFFFFVGFFSW